MLMKTFWASRFLVHSLLCFPLLAALGCEKKPEREGPREAVIDFVSAMSKVHGDLQAGEEAAALMWEPARKNLKERARRASALSGRELSAAEMIAPSWFAMKIRPESADERIDGDWAEVSLRDATGQQAQVRCLREADGWKVALELPPLAPIRQRDSTPAATLSGP